MPYCPECSAAVPDDAADCPTCGAPVGSTATTEVDAPQRPKLNVERLQQTLSATLSPGYDVIRLLGQGGMGAVFLAKESALKRLVAVKVMAPDLAADHASRTRFEREARAAAALSHPNVVRVYAVGETKRTKLPYIIMQYVEGPTLEEWALRKGKVSEREGRRIVGEIAAALAAAHERDLVHRDIKPSNVLMEADTGRAFVADFGVTAALPSAQTAETKLTGTGVVMGTPTYMSPEQSAGDPITPRSDVYSLGVVAYQLFTGELPFAATTAMGWAAAHQRDKPTPTAEQRPELSPAVAQMVDRCLAKSADDRPSARELSQGMLPSLATEIEWPPPGLQWLLGHARTLSRLALAAAVGAALATAALTFIPEVLTTHQTWIERFQQTAPFTGVSPEERQRATNTAALALFAWQSVLVLGIVAFGMAALGFVGATSRALGRVIRQRMLGWTLGTLHDVAADYDGRSGLVLSGSADFVSFSEARRSRILWLRRNMVNAFLAGALWISIAFGVRSILIVLGVSLGAGQETLFTASDAILILAPGGVLLIIGAITQLSERWLLGRLGQPQSFDAEPAEIANWYAALPANDARPAPVFSWRQDQMATWTSRVIRGAFLILVPIAFLGLVVGGLAALSAARFPDRFGPATAALLAALEQIDHDDPMRSARQRWAPYLPTRSDLPEASATRLLRTLLQPPSTAGDSARFPVSTLEFLPSARNVRSPFDLAVRRRIPRDTLAILRSIASHPRTILIGRLAQAPQVDVLEAMLGGPPSQYTLNTIPFAFSGHALLEAVRANELAAVLETAEGRPERAYDRLGENASIGEHLLNALGGQAYSLALRVLREHVLEPLAQLDEARGNLAAARETRFANQTLDQFREVLRHAGFGMAGLAARERDAHQIRGILTNSRVPAGFRLAWLYHAWEGLCADPFEILVGPSQERSDSITALAASMADVPHAADYARMTGSAWRSPEWFADRDNRLLSLLEQTAPISAMGRLWNCGTFRSNP